MIRQDHAREGDQRQRHPESQLHLLTRPTQHAQSVRARRVRNKPPKIKLTVPPWHATRVSCGGRVSVSTGQDEELRAEVPDRFPGHDSPGRLSYPRRQPMPPSSTTVTLELVERARSGDVAACGRLVEATEGLVRAAVRRVTSDAALADDAVQETYLRAFASLRSLRDPTAFPAWLIRVAVSTARNELRRRRGSVVDPALLDALPARPDASDDREPLHAALRRAIVSLPDRDRRLCDRYYRGGWTTRRLAALESTSESAIRKRLQRLRDRLQKEMTMTLKHTPASNDGLSDRIIDLLSRPLLLDLPENPVGAIWDRIVALRSFDEVIDLPERLADADVRATVGLANAVELPPFIHRIDDGHFLRFDQTLPMLLAARGRPSGARLLAGGRVFRSDPEDAAHLEAFHQAEILWTGQRLTAWTAMDAISDILDDLLPGSCLRVEEADFPLYADRAHVVLVQQGNSWVSVAGWAQFRSPVVAALGLDPEQEVAIGVGLGLERIACLRYDIDDIRRVASSRVAKGRVED